MHVVQYTVLSIQYTTYKGIRVYSIQGTKRSGKRKREVQKDKGCNVHASCVKHKGYSAKIQYTVYMGTVYSIQGTRV